MNLQEDNQPKAFRPARLRARLQRPKPNVVKAAERKEILASQEEIGANVEKNENESCVDINVSILILHSVFVKYIASFHLLFIYFH